MGNKKTGDKLIAEEKKVAKRQTYTLEHLTYEDGSTCLRRTNDGFDLFQLLGMFELTRRELFSLFENGYPKPDEIERKLIKTTTTHETI